MLLHNITEEDVDKGRAEYEVHGAGSLKKKTALTPKNIFEKVALFTELHLGPTNRQLSFQDTLVEMLRTGMYNVSSAWIVPFGGRGMSHLRAAALWRLVSEPGTARPEDVHR